MNPDPPGQQARPFAVTIAIAAMTVGFGLLWLTMLYLRYREGTWVDGTWVFASEAWAVDLRAYIGAAGRLVDEGSLYASELVSGSFTPGPEGLFYYAPPLGVAMLPFTDLSLADSSTIWWVLRVGALLLACLLMPVQPLLRATAFAVVALSLPGLKDSVIGNISLLLLLPMVVAWRWMDRPIGSIAMAAAISLRPSLGLFLIWQLLRRSWRAALWTVGAGLALLALSVPFVGIEGLFDYAAVVRNVQVPAVISENRDIGALALALGADGRTINLVRLLAIVAASIALVLSVRRDREVSFMVMLSASLLISPLLWSHYLATLVVPSAFLAHRLWKPLILLPLLAWLPIMAPALVAAAMLLPFLVRDTQDEQVPEPVRLPA